MAGKIHDFCWNELVSTDVSKSKEFYSKLFNWTPTDMSCEGMQYTVFKNGENEIGGLMQKPEGAECSCDKGAAWIPYVSVANVDDSVKKAEQLGAKILLKPMDIAEVGRIAVVKDSVGAVFGMITEVK